MRQQIKKALAEILKCARQRMSVEKTCDVLQQSGHTPATINTAVDLLRDQDCIAEFLIDRTDRDCTKLGWRLTWRGVEMIGILEDENKEIGFRI